MKNPVQPHSDNGKAEDKKQWRPPGWLLVAAVVVGSIIALGIIVAGLFVVSLYLSSTSDPVQFVTGNLLNVLLLAAIAAQVFIYLKQRRVMERQLKISTRAYVGVHNIKTEKEPVRKIVFKVGNIGHVPSEGVYISGHVVFNPPNYSGQVRPKPKKGIEMRSVPFHRDFRGSELPPGKLEIKVFIPIHRERYFTNEQLEPVFDGKVPFIIQIKVEYGDGFGSQEESEVAFLFVADGPGWMMHPVRDWGKIDREDESLRDEEEQAEAVKTPAPKV